MLTSLFRLKPAGGSHFLQCKKKQKGAFPNLSAWALSQRATVPEAANRAVTIRTKSNLYSGHVSRICEANQIAHRGAQVFFKLPISKNPSRRQKRASAQIFEIS